MSRKIILSADFVLIFWSIKNPLLAVGSREDLTVRARSLKVESGNKNSIAVHSVTIISFFLRSFQQSDQEFAKGCGNCGPNCPFARFLGVDPDSEEKSERDAGNLSAPRFLHPFHPVSSVSTFSQRASTLHHSCTGNFYTFDRIC